MFNSNLEQMKLDPQLEKASKFLVSESKNKVVIQEDAQICSYDYAITGTNFKLQNSSKNCIDSSGDKEISLFFLEGYDYPMLDYNETHYLRVYSWDLKEVKIEYSNWEAN